MLGIWIAHKFGAKLGDKNKGVDSMNMGGALKILEDYVVSTTLLMLIFFGIILCIIGEAFIEKCRYCRIPG